MKRSVKKYLMVGLMLCAGTLIFLYAQKGFLFQEKEEIKTGNEIAEAEPTDDIGTLTSDDPWQEMDKLVATYYNKEGISYKGQVKLIDDNGEKEKVIEEHQFEYSAINSNMYYRLGNVEVVSKADLVLVADHTNRFITVSSQTHYTPNQTKKLFDIAEFKKVMVESKAAAKVTQAGDQKILTIEKIADPQIQGYRIYYDPGTYKINKMLIGMVRLSPLSDEESGIEDAPDPSDDRVIDNKNNSQEIADDAIPTYTYYLEIIYDQMKILGIKEKTFQPENKFIIRTDNKFQLTPAFSKYQFISNGDVQNETEKFSEEQK